jgi:glutamate 5-kinase
MTAFALVTNLVDAGLLVIRPIDGFTMQSTQNPSKLIPLVRTSQKSGRAAGGSSSTVGTGGMATKLAAAKKAEIRAATLIVNGADPDYQQLFRGEECGTLFAGGKSPQTGSTGLLLRYAQGRVI